ncbi:MAG: DUF1722 domain-containing protein [Thermodesulfobacteriota bacterium]
MRGSGGEEGGHDTSVRFQAENKLLLMTHNQNEMRALGRIVANARGRPPESVINEYGEGWRRCWPLPRRASNVSDPYARNGIFPKRAHRKGKGILPIAP